MTETGHAHRRSFGWIAALAAVSVLSLACPERVERAEGAPGLALADEPCDPTRSAIAGAAESLIAADNRRDLEAVLGHYTDGAILLPPTGEVVSGKEAIGARYRTLFEQNLVEFSIEIDEAHPGGAGWAWVRGETAGKITPLDGGDALHPHATFLMVLRCEEGSWRVHRLSWSEGESASGAE